MTAFGIGLIGIWVAILAFFIILGLTGKEPWFPPSLHSVVREAIEDTIVKNPEYKEDNSKCMAKEESKNNWLKIARRLEFDKTPELPEKN